MRNEKEYVTCANIYFRIFAVFHSFDLVSLSCIGSAPDIGTKQSTWF